MGAEDEIEMGDIRQQTLTLLLGNTATDPQDQTAFLPFPPFELGKVIVDLLFRFGPDAAGIEYDEICVGYIPGGVITGPFQQCDDFFRITDIHLAAEGLEIKPFFSCHVVPLPLNLALNSTQFASASSTYFLPHACT